MSQVAATTASAPSFQEQHAHQYSLHTFLTHDVLREYYTYTPSVSKLDKNGHLVFLLCFDGLTLGNRNGLPWTNRVNEIAEKYGFYAIYPVAQKRLQAPFAHGVYYNNCWNAPGGMMRYRKNQQNDILFIRMLRRKLMTQHIDRPIHWVGIGMSAGAQFVHFLARNKLVHDVVSVSGTWLDDQLRPGAGINMVAFCGDADPLTKWEGGFGGDWKRRTLSLPVLRNGWNLLFDKRYAKNWSQPQRQGFTYATVNGVHTYRTPVEDHRFYKRYQWDAGETVICCYLILGGGHTWHGRLLNESEFSGAHGRPLSADVFDTNEIWVKELGLDQMVPETAP